MEAPRFYAFYHHHFCHIPIQSCQKGCRRTRSWFISDSLTHAIPSISPDSKQCKARSNDWNKPDQQQPGHNRLPFVAILPAARCSQDRQSNIENR